MYSSQPYKETAVPASERLSQTDDRDSELSSEDAASSQEDGVGKQNSDVVQAQQSEDHHTGRQFFLSCRGMFAIAYNGNTHVYGSLPDHPLVEHRLVNGINEEEEEEVYDGVMVGDVGPASERVLFNFYWHPLMESGIEIKLFSRCSDSPAHQAQLPVRTSIIRLAHQNTNCQFSYVPLSGHHSQDRIKRTFGIEDIEAECLLYVLNIAWEVDPNTPTCYSAGLFTPVEGWGNQSVKHEALQNLLKESQNVECLVVQYGDLAEIINRHNHGSSSQLRDPGRYLHRLKEHLTRQARALQVGQKLDPQDYPSIGEMRYQPAFVDRDTMVVYVGYGLLYEADQALTRLRDEIDGTTRPTDAPQGSGQANVVRRGPNQHHAEASGNHQLDQKSVGIQTITSALAAHRKCAAWTHLHLTNPQRQWDILCANNLRAAPFNIESMVPESFRNDFWVNLTHRLTADQARAATMMARLPHGVGVLRGSSGTGKTFFGRRIVQTLASFNHESGPKTFVILCPVHDLGAALALDYYQGLTRQRNRAMDEPSLSPPETFVTRLPVVVHLQNLHTAKAAITSTPHRQANQPHAVVADFLAQGGPDVVTGNIKELGVVLGIYQELVSWIQRPCGAASKRPKPHVLSVGFWACVKAGFHDPPPGYGFYSEADHYTHFRKQYRSSLKQGASTDQEKAGVITQYNAIIQSVISTADVVVTTPSNVGDPKFSMSPSGVIIEEASRCDIGDWAMALHHLPTAQFFLVSGDRLQPKPFTVSNLANNPFHAQITMPLLSHLVRQGFPVTRFTHQSRFPPHINELARLRYREIGMSDNNYDKPHWIPAREYTQRFFGSPTNVRFLDMDSEPARLRSSTSIYNMEETVALVDEAKRLIEFGYTADQISILLPYGDAVKIAKRVTAHKFDRDSYSTDIMPYISTIDAFVGQESPVVLLALCIDRRIGFMAEDFRPTLAVTRATALLIVAGNMAEIQRAPRLDRSILMEQFSVIKNNHWVTRVRPEISPRLKAALPEIYDSHPTVDGRRFLVRPKVKICILCGARGHVQGDCPRPYHRRRIRE